MNANLDISILIATYNRADDLHQTLEAMSQVDREGLAVEFVVVDNNSTDNTREVVESFAGCLPVRYLFEPNPGKNCALNRALRESNLGRVVVFTDDDVNLEKNWLKAIVKSCERQPEYDVFGGKVYSVWPNDVEIPGWAYRDDFQWVFSPQDLGDTECCYPSGRFPTGANMWVRRRIFEDGRRFNESFGTMNRKGGLVGSEASFLFALAAEGYCFLYVPEAVVGHRIQKRLLSESKVLQRAYSHGRSAVQMKKVPRLSMLKKYPNFWRFMRGVSVARYALQYVFTRMPGGGEARFRKRVQALWSLGYNLEALRIKGVEPELVSNYRDWQSVPRP